MILINYWDYYVSKCLEKHSGHKDINGSAKKAFNRRNINLFAPDNYLSRPPYDMQNGIRSMICFCGPVNGADGILYLNQGEKVLKVVSRDHNFHQSLLTSPKKGYAPKGYEFCEQENISYPNEQSPLFNYKINYCQFHPCVCLDPSNFSYYYTDYDYALSRGGFKLKTLNNAALSIDLEKITAAKNNYMVFIRKPDDGYSLKGFAFYADIREQVNDIIHLRFYGNLQRNRSLYITRTVLAI